MYAHDLESLFQLLIGQSGILHLEPAEDAGNGELWHAYLLLAKGGVMTCDVRSKGNGRVLLSGSEAMAWLASAGSLSWSLEGPFQSSQPFAAPLALHVQRVRSLGLLIPQRTGQGEEAVMLSWSRKQRQVFALVDGVRSIQRIAAMLSQPHEVVEGVLNALQSMGVIEK